MHTAPKHLLGIAVVVLVVAGLGTYVYFQSNEFLRGPVLTLLEPENGSMSTSSRVTLLGSGKNISFLTLNGRRIFTDEQGRFRESLLLPEGYSIMTIEAKDRFGHRAEKRLELVYRPESQNAKSKMENATTTNPQF